MTAIRLLEVPKWGLTMEEGTLNAWLITEGHTFSKGDEVCEIETSKITNVMEAPFAGTLRRIVASPGDVLPVGAMLGVIAEADVSEADIDAFLAANRPVAASAASSASAQSAPASDAAPEPAATAVQTPQNVPAVAHATPGTEVPEQLRGYREDATLFSTTHALRLASKWNIDLSKVPGSGREGRISVNDIESAIAAAGARLVLRPAAARSTQVPRSKADDSQVAATPLARRLAGQMGVNLLDCKATGTRGRVCKADVEVQALLQNPPSANAGSPVAAAEHSATAVQAFIEQPLSAMRRAIGARLQASKRNAPHFRVSADLDLGTLLSLREEINRSVPGVKLSVNDFLIKACASALRKVPAVNVQFDEASQSIRQFSQADISVAVSMDSGLITPIVFSACSKSLSQISADMLQLITKAKTNLLKPAEFQGGTFTISNLGMFGVSQFDAIINPPQVAILAIGSCEERVVVRDGQMVVRSLMTVSLSCDHRVVDGVTGALFLKELKRLVESPALMMV
jgi:pyruvate dehydrogenase E2 component (dihydrolipoamide acetyltransferase)